MAQPILSSSLSTNSSSSFSSMDLISRTSATKSAIFGSTFKLVEIEQTHLRLITSVRKVMFFKITDYHATFKIEPKRNNPALRLKASRDSPGMTRVLTIDQQKSVEETQNGAALFSEMKHRFLSFKKHQYSENLESYQNLSKGQAPKFLVIACADSRVCPSSILGFQPGEAFVVRNVANLVPPFENGPTETNAALEFAVNALEVENILVMGHTCCGGIRALMSMQDEADSSFIRNWVVVGKNASLSTKAVASNLSFDQQCRHCEKESVNRSLLSLLTYPWIQERVAKGSLSIHGGYYDFIDCTFEKWTLDYNGTSLEQSGKYSLKDREFWC